MPKCRALYLVAEQRMGYFGVSGAQQMAIVWLAVRSLLHCPHLSLSLSLSQAASVYSCSACAGVYTLYSDTLLLHSQVQEFGPKKVQMSAAGKRIPNLIVIPGVHPAGFYEWLFSKGLAHLFDCITIVS